MELPVGHVELTAEDFKRPPKPLKGNKTPAAIYQAMGRSLTQWAHLERELGRLFMILVQGQGPGLARGFGAIASAHGRIDVLKAAAEAELIRFGKSDLLTNLNTRLSVIDHASGRRNDIAHGNLAHIADYGHVLVPSLDDPKRTDLSSPRSDAVGSMR